MNVTSAGYTFECGCAVPIKCLLKDQKPFTFQDMLDLHNFEPSKIDKVRFIRKYFFIKTDNYQDSHVPTLRSARKAIEHFEAQAKALGLID